VDGRFAKCVVAAVLLGLTASGVTIAHGSGPSAVASGQKTYAKFTGVRLYKPSTLGFGAHEQITEITWSKWGKKLAIGHGTYQVNDCVPDCADGTITPTPSTIYLTGRTTCGGHFIFKRLKVFFAGRKRTSLPFCKR
jgi:hypothetical protein